MSHEPSFETWMYIVVPLSLLALAIGLILFSIGKERARRSRNPKKKG